MDTQALRIGPSASVGSVISLAPFVEIGGVASAALDVLITPQALSHALSAGFDGEVMRTRLELLAPLPDPIARTLTQASTVIGRAEFVLTQGFLWVEDPEVRELLRTRRQSADLFVDSLAPRGPALGRRRGSRACGAALPRAGRGSVGRWRGVSDALHSTGTRQRRPPPRLRGHHGRRARAVHGRHARRARFLTASLRASADFALGRWLHAAAAKRGNGA